MIDIVFSKDNEAAFSVVASRLGVELIFVPDKDNLIGIYPNAKQAILQLIKADSKLREQTSLPVDGFFGIEEFPTKGIGVDNVILSLLSKKNKFVLFFLRPLLTAEREERIQSLEKIQMLIPLLRKYHVPIILASGAQTPYDLRHVHDMEAFAILIGMTPKEAKQSLTLLKERILSAQKRKKGEILSSGVIVQP